MSKYYTWMNKDFRRGQDWKAKVEEWIKRHAGRGRVKDCKDLQHVHHVEASTTSGRKARAFCRCHGCSLVDVMDVVDRNLFKFNLLLEVHRPQTCFVPSEHWPEEEYGAPPGSDKQVKEVLVEGEGEVMGYYVTGGYGKPHHWLIDDYVDKNISHNEVLEHSRDKHAAKEKFNQISSAMIKKTKEDHKKVSVVSKQLDVDAIMNIINSATTKTDGDGPEKPGSNNSDGSSSDLDEDDQDKAKAKEKSDEEESGSDDGNDVLRRLGLAPAKAVPKAAAGGGGGGGGGRSGGGGGAGGRSGGGGGGGGRSGGGGGTSTKTAVVKPAVVAVVKPAVGASGRGGGGGGKGSNNEIVSLDGRGKRLIASLEEIADTVLKKFENALEDPNMDAFNSQVLWKDKKLEGKFNDFLKASLKSNSILINQIKAAVQRIIKSPNQEALSDISKKFSQMFSISTNFDKAVKLMQMTTPPNNDVVEILGQKVLSEVELPLPFHVTHFKAVASLKAM